MFRKQRQRGVAATHTYRRQLRLVNYHHGGAHVWDAGQELVVGEEDVDVVFLDTPAELFGGGADVEEEDGAAGVAFGAQRQDDAASVAGDDADARLIGDAEDPAGDVARLGAEVAVGEEAGVVDKGGALGGRRGSPVRWRGRW